MARPSPREGIELAERRRRVSEMYLQGFRQTDIATRLGIDQATVSRDLAAIRAVWQEQRTVNYGEKVDAELARLDAVQAAAWTAFEKSKLPKRKRGKRGTVAFSESEKQVGHPRFLEIVRRCVVDRARLLGLPIESTQQPAQSTATPESRKEHSEMLRQMRELLAKRRGEMQPDPEAN